MRYAYLVVEGPHDVEFVGRLLKPYQFTRIRLESRLDPYWTPVVPTKFPFGGDLSQRVPVPTFFSSVDVSVAVNAAGGDSRIAPQVEETLAVLSTRPQAIGALLDADSQNSPAQRFNTVRAELNRLGLPFPAQAGQVSAATPQCGIFVLPDNQTAGTLEDLLLECARLSYPGLLTSAQALVGSVRPDDSAFTAEDMKDFRKPAGSEKATVACIAGILKPGKAVQVSIQDNRWLDEQTMNSLPRIKAVQRFLADLLSLP
ncbi:DUF3226 domain-containing protein [Hyalangium versicolor]|uniref:DUF3226 domain-containing protein n=1 Tax=Hyalangium versicolor TaxID=2861190 RepID=UPI001CC93BAE|nr:DUF3226 domain-containing protein [Hyalangium versicolor]